MKTDKRFHWPSGGLQAARRIGVAVAALHHTPDRKAERLSEALYGELVILHHVENGFGLVQLQTDGHVGWMALAEITSADGPAPTHRVRAAAAHAWDEASIKAPVCTLLPSGARLAITDEYAGRFVKAAHAGWVIADRLAPMNVFEDDPATVALRYQHVPYLWGGRSHLGIDCSGLVQQAFAACGINLPRDSDMQRTHAGPEIAGWDSPDALQRNDLVFWTGHVGVMLDGHRLIHANAHHMAVTVEPLQQAISRIADLHGPPCAACRPDIDAMRGKKPDWFTLATQHPPR